MSGDGGDALAAERCRQVHPGRWQTIDGPRRPTPRSCYDCRDGARWWLARLADHGATEAVARTVTTRDGYVTKFNAQSDVEAAAYKAGWADALSEVRQEDAAADHGATGLQRRLYDGEKRAGWDPSDANTFGEEVAHLHEEASEAFRAWRKTKDCSLTTDDTGKPQGVPAELADLVIGAFFIAERWGFDLLAAVDVKHQYNLTRSYADEGRRLHEPTADHGATGGQAAVEALRFRVEVACDGYAGLTDDDVPDHFIGAELDAYREGAAEASREIRAAFNGPRATAPPP